MAYTNIISRDDAAALIPEEVAAGILDKLPEQSAALTMFRQVRMSRKQQRMAVIAALPLAYFVTGDTGLKQTSEANWANKYLNAETLAVLIPIPEDVLDDADFDIWGQVKPKLVEAFGRTLDAAIFFGTNKPSTWPSDIVTAAVAAGNNYTRGTNNQAAGGIAEDMNQVIGKIEADGFDPTGIVAARTIKARLRAARATTGERLPEIDMAAGAYDGIPIKYPMRGLWPTGSGAAELIAGDFGEGIIGLRQDITYKLLDQAPVTDQLGNIIYNPAQQDMVVLRAVMRVGWQVSNVVNWDQPVEASRFPFSVLQAP